MGAKSSSRDGTRISLIAIHTNEGPNPAGDEGRDASAENLARYMDGVDVSYHRIVDDDSVVNYVPDDRMCWALRSGNRRSLNICMTGYARMSRGEWLTHDRMLRQTAAVVRAWCDQHGVPRVRLSPTDVGNDHAGICGHVDWTYGKRDGTHTDPGAGFPWDVFLGYVESAGAPAAPKPAPPVQAGPGELARGMRDPQPTGGPIWRAQDKLKRGYKAYAGHIGVDGIFGIQTEGVVREFQKRSRLPVNGRIDAATWRALGL